MIVGDSPSPVLPGVSTPVEAKPLGLGPELEPLAPGVLVALENDKEIVGPLDAGGAETEPAIHLVTERGARVTKGRAVMG